MSGMAGHESPNEGATNVWLTPKHVIDALGPFDLDPCAATVRPFDCAAVNITERDDGLSRPWGDAFVWCNPPYGPHVGKWLERMIEHGNGIALVFARTETRAMQPAFKACDAVLFVAGRLTFTDERGVSGRGNAGAPSMLLAFGDLAVKRLGASGIAGAFFEAYGRSEAPLRAHHARGQGVFMDGHAQGQGMGSQCKHDFGSASMRMPAPDDRCRKCGTTLASLAFLQQRVDAPDALRARIKDLEAKLASARWECHNAYESEAMMAERHNRIMGGLDAIEARIAAALAFPSRSNSGSQMYDAGYRDGVEAVQALLEGEQ